MVGFCVAMLFSKIPTIVSSVTFLAAATSIPDAVSSMAVARKGRGAVAHMASPIRSPLFYTENPLCQQDKLTWQLVLQSAPTSLTS